MNSVIGAENKGCPEVYEPHTEEMGYLIYADGKYISRLENGGSL
ncbi:MAG: hypothetical protein ACLTDF_09685 [Coprococcus sp.]